MKTFPNMILAALATGFLSAGLFCQQTLAASTEESASIDQIAGLQTPRSSNHHHTGINAKHRLRTHSGLNLQTQAPVNPLIGNITFAGTVNLDTSSAGTATMVVGAPQNPSGWHGLSTTPTAGLPQVQS